LGHTVFLRHMSDFLGLNLQRFIKRVLYRNFLIKTIKKEAFLVKLGIIAKN
jgi:hypothetical protein